MSFRFPALRRLLTFSLPLLAFTSCKDDPVKPAATVYNHTVVAYIVAENSLSSYLNRDFREMIAGHESIPADAQLLAFIDDRSNPRLYRITAATDSVCLYTWPTDICATDSASMCDVLDKVRQFSEGCDRYDLLMSSHASGWIPAVNRYYTRSFGIDNNQNTGSNSGVEMNVPTLRDVLATKLGRVGYIFFDACYMQCIEVDYELRSVADYVVASPTEIPGDGADYCNMMPCFFASDAPERIVEQYYADETAKRNGGGVVISAVKTAETPALALAAQPIVQQMCQGRTSPDIGGVQSYGPFSYQTMYRPLYCDMLGLALTTDDEAALGAFRRQLDRTVTAYRATQKWLTAFPHLFDASMDDITRTCGVSMFAPNEMYEGHEWNHLYQDTGWYTAAGFSLTGW